jgi:hypothetical protein
VLRTDYELTPIVLTSLRKPRSGHPAFAC